MKRFKRQVNPNHYYQLKYDTKKRWISYWYQIHLVLEQRPKTVLEIGVGNKTVSDYLKKLKMDIKTCDIDPLLKPDVISDVRMLPFSSNSFDVVLCAEVLEHLPFRDLVKSLKEIHRVCKKILILTLPHFSVINLYLGIKLIPYIKIKEVTCKIDLPIKHKFRGEHYWEIGKKGYPLERIQGIIRNSGFEILNSFYPKENPFHHFFILKKTA